MELFSLIGQKVVLHPMQLAHADALVAAAADGELWSLGMSRIPRADTVHAYIDTALAGRRAGTAIPFVTTLADSGRIVGATRFWQIDTANRKREIGSTWIARSWQGSFVNAEAKYLMLRHAFEYAKCIRVQLQTDALNARSRAAILKLGAREEGIARNERIMPDGRVRDSVQFSIIDAEWPEVRARLETRLAALGIAPQFIIAPAAESD
ncbi:MAG: acetyltransferase, family [Rhodocyclales bacterium]|nr:acetyltransferase, family [Rhodocyclales bacterium]MDB5887714.1 acetyltransferase, family [Rhodocyclales bacterium]